jgi:DNA-binding NarL/FixJ family response regulator
VARLFAEGQTHSQIAERLGVSQSTIRHSKA